MTDERCENIEMTRVLFGYISILNTRINVCRAEEKQHSKGYFNHDCPPRLNTAGGEPIFNSERDLVGISCKNRGVTCAMDVNTITKGISLFHQGMENKVIFFLYFSYMVNLYTNLAVLILSFYV